MWRGFKSLPAYMGGKRQLVSTIFKYTPPPVEAPVFCDAFMGGGSVSLFAKAQGYQVIGNDVAQRSFIVGQALIENSTVKLNPQDLAKLFQPIKNGRTFCSKNLVPKVLTTRQAEFLDTAFSNLDKFSKETGYLEKWALLTLVLIKHIFSVRHFGKFTHTKDAQDLEKKSYDYPLRSSSFAHANLRMVRNPYRNLEIIMQQVNRGVFYTGKDCKVYSMDVQRLFDEKGMKPDIVYLDPPYPGTSSYEQEYNVLDSILLGEWVKDGVNPWTNEVTAPKEFTKLFSRLNKVKTWIISMGQTDPDSGISAESMVKLVQEHRPAELHEVEHRWSMANAGGKNRKGTNVEYLIVAKL